MIRAVRARWVELELLLIPSLLILSGLLLVIIVPRGRLVWDWRDISTSWAFIAALLFVHVFLTARRFRGDQVLFPTVAMLTALGLVMIQRLDSPGAKEELQGLAIRQTLWVFAGLAVFAATLLFFDRVLVLRRYKYLVALFGLLLLVGLISPLGTEINGARLWYDFRVMLFQPGEIVKVILVFFFATYLDERRDLLAGEYRVGPLRLPPLPYLAPMLLMWGASMLVIVFLRDLGTALLFFGIFLSMLYAVTGRALYVWALGGLFFAGAYLAYQTFGHVQVRVNTWLDPFAPEYVNPSGVVQPGYQITQSLFALASGGVYGAGLGYGRPTAMPAVQTDMIFSAIGEELGLIGSLGLLGLYLVLVFRGFYIALSARRGFYQLLAVGLTAIFGLQTFIIVAGDLKLIPLTGITLPFVAYGGSSIVTNFLIAGLLLGISGADKREVDA